MRFKFWGVRGSLPKPLSPQDIKNKISTVIQRIRPEDARDAISKEKFIATLPKWLYGSAGGNTSTIEIRLDNNTCILMDAGSGIRDFSDYLRKHSDKTKVFHIFFSHFHWDHLMGLPFFTPAFNPACTLYLYSPVKNLKEILAGQMVPPYFPVTMDAMKAKMHFIHFDKPSVQIGRATISKRAMNHPGGCYSYKVESGGKSVLYATDTELSEMDFLKNEENIRVFQNLDVLILDTQYTLGEALEKYNWGHSSFALAVDFAKEWNVKTLYMFHHEPLYDDRQLHENLMSARSYLEHLNAPNLSIEMAIEGGFHEL